MEKLRSNHNSFGEVVKDINKILDDPSLSEIQKRGRVWVIWSAHMNQASEIVNAIDTSKEAEVLDFWEEHDRLAGTLPKPLSLEEHDTHGIDTSYGNRSDAW